MENKEQPKQEFPQEEPNYNMKQEIEWVSNNLQCKQIDICYNSLSKKCICLKEEPKQEALEAFTKEVLEDDFFTNISEHRKAERFIELGANWQAERMYSEEEVIELLNKHEDYVNSEDNIFEYLTAKEWFKQYKKK